MAGLGSNRTPPAYQGASGNSSPAAHRSIPREVIAMVGTAFGVLIAVGTGSLIADRIPDHSPWLFMLSYAAPAAVVFAVFWLISRRF